MNIELLFGLMAFAFASSITPGPNNIMLMTSGVNFGLLRTLPHMMGVGIGFGLMVLLMGIGLGSVFAAYPLSHEILKWFAVVYLLYLAYKIATSGTAKASQFQESRPFSFMQALLFQWVNPKAWTMALTAVSVYSGGQQDTDIYLVVMVTLVFVAINMPCIFIWTYLGHKLSDLFKQNHYLRLFNICMAALLVCSLYPLFLSA